LYVNNFTHVADFYKSDYYEIITEKISQKFQDLSESIGYLDQQKSQLSSILASKNTELSNLKSQYNSLNNQYTQQSTTLAQLQKDYSTQLSHPSPTYECLEGSGGEHKEEYVRMNGENRNARSYSNDNRKQMCEFGNRDTHVEKSPTHQNFTSVRNQESSMRSIMAWGEQEEVKQSNLQLKQYNPPLKPSNLEITNSNTKFKQEVKIENKGANDDFVRNLAKQLNSFDQERKEECKLICNTLIVAARLVEKRTSTHNKSHNQLLGGGRTEFLILL
jgi:uncharacterized phage infection (PIP) family protein YhgE